MNKKFESTFVCGLLSVAILTCLAGVVGAKTPRLKEVERGRVLYMANCEACHMMGKNVIKPEKELVKSSKLQSERLFREYLSERHGVMPEFAEITKKEESIQALYRFVKTLKNQSWEYKMPEEPDEDEPQ